MSKVTETYYTYEQGVTDGETKWLLASTNGQSLETPIFFYLPDDFPCHPGSGVWSYIEGVRTALQMHGRMGPHTESEIHHVGAQTYELGVYGSSLVRKDLIDGGMVTDAMISGIAEAEEFSCL